VSRRCWDRRALYALYALWERFERNSPRDEIVSFGGSSSLSVVKVGAFAVGPKHGDEFDGAVDRAEPVWCEGAELDGFARLDNEVLFAEEEAHASVEDVHPVVAVVDSQRLSRWRASALGADSDLECAQPARGSVRERPHRQAVSGDGFAANPRIGRRRASEQLVGTDSERNCESGDVVEGEATFSGLEAAEHRDVDAGAIADLLKGQTLIEAKLT